MTSEPGEGSCGGTDDLVQRTLTDHLNTVRDIAKYDPGTDMITVVTHLVYDAVGLVTAGALRRSKGGALGKRHRYS